MNYIEQIRNSIEDLKSGSKLSIWNREVLNYNLLIKPCISESELNALEDMYKVKLPSEYREYVLNIGNGGNQPEAGMFTAEQSLALMFNEKTDAPIDYNDLTQYYAAINRDGYADLLDCFYSIFNEIIEHDNEPCVLEDFFTEEGLFKYRDLYDSDIDSFAEYESAMMKHLLIFSFNNECRVIFAIALDGVHKDQVIYYSCESNGAAMRDGDIVFTNMSFLEWMNALYNNSCIPYDII